MRFLQPYQLLQCYLNYTCIEIFYNYFIDDYVCLLVIFCCRECNLHKYVTDFIKNKFNKHIHTQMSTTIKAETEGSQWLCYGTLSLLVYRQAVIFLRQFFFLLAAYSVTLICCLLLLMLHYAWPAQLSSHLLTIFIDGYCCAFCVFRFWFFKELDWYQKTEGAGLQ